MNDTINKMQYRNNIAPAFHNEHGDEYKGELRANFSSNVWHSADNTGLYNHLSSSFAKTRRYPEIEAESLKIILSEKHTLKPTQISIGNGSIDIIYRVAQAYRSTKSLIVSPTFSEYSKACTLNEHTVQLCCRENLSINIDTFQPNLVWLCNPNNPDGTCFNRKELQVILYTYPQVTFIVDQSFVDFTLHETLTAKSVSEFPNLVLIYSLTKRYTIPGLRIGYVIASESTIVHLDRYKIPWSVNTLAVEAGKYILTQKQDNSFNLKAWLTETIRFQNEIERIGIFETRATHTPFFLVKLLKGKADELKDFLLKVGILIRNANNFDYEGCELIRLNTLTELENNLLIEKLIEWKHTL
jgi:threonine-phosphate decarboxylase